MTSTHKFHRAGEIRVDAKLSGGSRGIILTIPLRAAQNNKTSIKEMGKRAVKGVTPHI